MNPDGTLSNGRVFFGVVSTEDFDPAFFFFFFGLAASAMTPVLARPGGFRASIRFHMAGQQSMYTESLRAFLKPVLQYLDDDSVSEIMINGPGGIYFSACSMIRLLWRASSKRTSHRS